MTFKSFKQIQKESKVNNVLIGSMLLIMSYSILMVFGFELTMPTNVEIQHVMVIIIGTYVLGKTAQEFTD